MFKKERDVIAVSFADEAFKVVSLKVSGQVLKVTDVLRKDLRNIEEGEVVSVIEDAWKSLRLKNKGAQYVLPSGMVITKNIEIPSLDPKEIQSIIDLQAGRHTPFSREEILVSHVTIGVFQRNYTKVLLVIVNREALKKQIQIMDDAGIKIERVLFSAEGVARFYAHLLQTEMEGPPVGILDMANKAGEFIMQFNRTVASARRIPVGMSQLIKDGDAAKAKLFEEIRKSLDAYQGEDISALPDRFVLTSDDDLLKELQPELQKQLKANVQIVPFLDQIEAPQSVMLRFVSEYNDDSFLSLVAQAFQPEAIQVDLTPEEIRIQRTLEEKTREGIRAGILAFLLLVLVGGTFLAKIYFKSIYLESLKKDYVEKRRAVIALDKIATRTRIIKDFVNHRMVSLDVIDHLYSLIPDEIYLQNVLFDDETGTINIQGISEAPSVVFNFVSRLEESDFFKEVKPRATAAAKDRGKDVTSFDIEFRLESAPDIEEEEVSPEEGEETPPGEES